MLVPRENKKSVARVIIPCAMTFDFFSRYIFLEYTLHTQGVAEGKSTADWLAASAAKGVGICEFICVLPAG